MTSSRGINNSRKCIVVVKHEDLDLLDEVKTLVRESGYEILDLFIVKRCDPRCYLSKGKLEEMKKILEKHKLDMDNNRLSICIYDELKPRQVTCLMRELGVQIVDKVFLILDIFSQHAGSKEAKLQIELARLRHELPLIRDWLRRVKLKELPGFLGPGRYAIDAYYRHIRKRITRIAQELEELRLRRERERRARREYGFLHIAIAGYTNSGKTTLFNTLTNLRKPTGTEMFTTLSTKSYAVKLCGSKIVIVDTVGFVRKIPIEIIEAFNAVLEEISDADILLLVLDTSEPLETMHYKLESSIDILRRIGALGKPLVLVLNKIDMLSSTELENKVHLIMEIAKESIPNLIDVVPMSALKRVNIDKLKDSICRAVSLLQKS